MKTVRLSDGARARMREQLSAYADLHSMPSQTGGSFQILPFMMMAFTRSRPVFAGALMVVLVAGVGGTAALAAEGTVPGDVLYPVKVSVNEPVASVFAGSGEGQARFRAKLAVRRVEEAARLDAEGKLTPEVEAQLADKFEAEATRALETAEKLAAGGDMSAPLAIRAELADNPVVQQFALAAPVEDEEVVPADAPVLAVADVAADTGDAPVAATMMMAAEAAPEGEAIEARTMLAADTTVAPESASAPMAAKQAPVVEQSARKAVVVQGKLPESIRARIARTVALLEQRTAAASVSDGGAIESVAAVQIARPQQQEGSQALLTGTSVTRAQRAKVQEQHVATTTSEVSEDNAGAAASVAGDGATATPAFDPELIREVGKTTNVIDAASQVLPVRLNTR